MIGGNQPEVLLSLSMNDLPKTPERQTTLTDEDYDSRAAAIARLLSFIEQNSDITKHHGKLSQLY